MKQAKNWMAIIVAVVLAFSAVPVRAQTSFLLGTAFGALLFGDGDHTGTAATVIYTLPKASERVKNPLEIRMASIQGSFAHRYSNYFGQRTLRELFGESVKNPEKYEIIQVVRVFTGESPQGAAIWFAYIEKESLLPLKQ